MNSRPRISAIAAAVFLASLVSAGAQTRKIPHFDIRTDAPEASRATADSLRAARAVKTGSAAALRGAMATGRSALAAKVPGLSVETNPATGAPEVVEAAMGQQTLTPASMNKPEAVVRGFLSDNASLFGLTNAQAADLRTIASYANPSGNLSWVEVEQSINGIPVFQGRLRAAVRKDGAIARTTGNLAAGLDAASLPTAPKLTAVAAAVAAAGSIGVVTDAASVPQLSTDEGGRKMTLAQGPFERETKAELIYFPLEPGVATLAYSLVLWEKHDAWYVLIDAESGQLLWRKNITNDQTQTATYSVYDDDSPAPLSPSNALPGSGIQGTPISRSTFTIVSELPAFDNLGWITDGGTTTTGNNVDAGLDLDSTNGIDAGSRPVSATRNFTFAYTPAGVPGEQSPTLTPYRNGVVTNLFFWTNRYHDRLYLYGFNEAAGNFQTNNFSRGGAGNDAISAEAQDSSGTNNANFSTPPDGQFGRMQMYLFNLPNPDRDGSLDQEIVIHELTHGLSNRLHANGSGLNTAQSGGMGEGWSDFYARCLLSSAAENVAGIYASGGYATYQLSSIGTDNYYYGIRRFPYAIKTTVGVNGKPHNPMTFADIDPAQCFTGDGAYSKSPVFANTAIEVHSIGEIWCMALLEVRARIITRLGWAAGNDRVLQIVTDAMKLDVASPTLIQARNSIISADTAGFAGADLDDIWAGFAAMGMGFNASITNSASQPASVTESFITPNLILGNVTFSDAGGNNDGFADPGESLLLTVPVTNLAALGKGTATGVLVSVAGGPQVSYGSINSGQTVSQQIACTVPPGTPAGTRLKVVVDIDSSFGPAGPVSQTFPLNVGQPVNGFTENFDALAGSALPSGWTTSKTGSGVAWVASTTNSQSPPKNAYSPNVGAVASAEMVTPAIPIISPGAQLSFRNSYNLEDSSGVYFWDGMVLEISVNNGPFQDIVEAGGVFLAGGYNVTLEYTGNPLAQRNAWGGLSAGTTATPGYITTTVLLPPSANGKSVKFKWIVGCDETATAAGAAGARIDGIVVTTGATVGATNHPPSINPQTFPVTEHKPVGTVVGTVAATDADAGQALTYSITGGNPGNAFAITPGNGQLTVNADLEHDTTPQFLLTVQVADDGVGTIGGPMTSSATITVNVNEPGMPPQIAGQNPVSVLEDKSRAIVFTDIIVNDPDSTYPNGFTLTVMDGTNYTRSGNTIAPVADYNGSLTVPVKVNDGESDSNTFNITVAVDPVNDAPSFTKGPDQAIIADSQPHTVSNWATNISTGPADESTQTPSFTVTTSNDAFFTSLPAVSPAGTLQYTAGAAVGSVTVYVTLHDDGGTANQGVDASAPQSFVITNSSGANDPPTFTIGPNVAAAQDAGAQTLTSYITAISPGPPDESGQAVSFLVTVDDAGLFDVPPAINPAGTLTFTPKATASGTTTVHVIAQDNGSTGNPGDDNTSDEQTFQLAVTTYQGHFGEYNGIALPALGATPSADKTGLLYLKFSAKGSYTAKLKVGGLSFSLTGTIDNAGVVRFGKNNDLVARLVRKNLPTLLLKLNLDVVGTSDQITGTLSPEVGPPSSNIVADLAPIYSKDNPSPYKGKYTVMFEKPQSLVLLPSAIPQGHGFGALEVSDKGVAKMTKGTLADGSKPFSYANAISKTGTWPLWVAFSKGAGALAGPVIFRNTPNTSDLDGPGLLWFRPVDLKTAKILYPGGWRNGITTKLVGSKYTPGAEVAACLDTALALGSPHPANLNMVGGPLSSPSTKVLSLDGKKVLCPADPNVKLTFTPATGLFKGTIVLPGNKKGTVQGAALQIQKMAFGFFTKEDSRVTGDVNIDP